MSSKWATLAVLAPLGAAMMLWASLTPYRVMQVIAEIIETPDAHVSAIGSGLRGGALVGLLGAGFLAVGMIAAARPRLQPTGKARLFLVASCGALGLAVLLIGYGNTTILIAFRNLASSENVSVDRLIGEINRAFVPFLSGYTCLVVAAAFVFVVRRASTESALGPTALRWLRLFATVGGAALLCLAAVWMTYSTFAFLDISFSFDTVNAAMVASSVSGVVLSVYLTLFGLTGFGLACLLGAAAATSKSKTTAANSQVVSPAQGTP